MTIRDQAGNVVTDAEVTISWREFSRPNSDNIVRSQSLTIQDLNTNVYEVPGFLSEDDEIPWASGYTFNIQRGSDSIEDVTVRSPDLHEILNPTRDTVAPAFQPLEVTWSGTDTARDLVRVGPPAPPASTVCRNSLGSGCEIGFNISPHGRTILEPEPFLQNPSPRTKNPSSDSQPNNDVTAHTNL